MANREKDEPYNSYHDGLLKHHVDLFLIKLTPYCIVALRGWHFALVETSFSFLLMQSSDCL